MPRDALGVCLGGVRRRVAISPAAAEPRVVCVIDLSESSLLVCIKFIRTHYASSSSASPSSDSSDSAGAVFITFMDGTGLDCLRMLLMTPFTPPGSLLYCK